MLKKILLTGAILISGNTIDSYAQNRSNIQLENSKKLVINTKNTTRKVTVLSELEGIAQIREFVDNSEFEESWIHNPKNNTWYETGYKETGWTNDVYPANIAYQDSAFIVKTLTQLERSVLFHLHPIKNYPDLRKTGVEADRYMASLWSDEQIESAIYLGNTIPSWPDINVAIVLQKKFSEKNYGDIVHKSVSSIGVTEFAFTQKGIDKIRQGKSSELEKKLYYDHAKLAKYIMFKNAEAYEDGEIVLDTKEYSKYMTEEVLKTWKNDYLQIKFTEFEN
jgi:hypothetical protein